MTLLFNPATAYQYGVYKISGIANPENLTLVCEQAQEKYLRDILGTSLYDAFEAGLNVVDPETVDQKWLDLKDGCNFIFGELTFRFKGLAKMVEGFCYFEFVKQNQTIQGATGQVLPINENSLSVSVNYPASRAFNNAISIQGEFYAFLSVNETVYTEFEPETVEPYEIINEFNI